MEVETPEGEMSGPTTTSLPTSSEPSTTAAPWLHQREPSNGDELCRREPSPIESNNLEGSQAAPDNITADSGIVSDESGAASGSPNTLSACILNNASLKRTLDQAFGDTATNPFFLHTTPRIPPTHTHCAPSMQPPIDSSTPAHCRPRGKREESANGKALPEPSGNNEMSHRRQESIKRKKCGSTATDTYDTDLQLLYFEGEAFILGINPPPHLLQHFNSKLLKQAVKVVNVGGIPHPVLPKTDSQPLDLSRKDSQSLSSRQTYTTPIEQPKNVPLAVPPAGARNSSEFVKTSRKIQRSTKKTNNPRKREIPLRFGDEEIVKLEVLFYECPERSRFCDELLEFKAPEIPTEMADQEEPRLALLALFANSNLPKVPTALMSNLNALIQYTKMQHLFHLARKGCDLETLKFSKSGQAFMNPKLLELGEKKLNAELDKMSYAGADGYLHCLVRRDVNDGAVCGHTAAEVGKMRRHARNHHPERKWVCCFCRVQMSDLTDMDRHISTHTDKKPFKCSECPQEFAQRVTLTTHMKNQHNKLAEKHDPRRSLTCRAHGLVFEAHQREACLEHIQKLHSNDMYQDRLRRNLWPINPNPTEKNSSATSSSSTTSGDLSDTENHV